MGPFGPRAPGREAARSIGQLMNTTADIVQHVQEAVANEVARVEAAGHSPASPSARGPASPVPPGAGALTPEEAARYDGLVHAMQRDSATYCDEPEDAAAYGRWRAGFDLGARRREVEGIMRGNSFMAELHHRIVPLIVDYDAFWTRYFYRLHCLEVAEGFVPSAPEEEAQGGGEEEDPLTDPPADEADKVAESLKGSSLLDEAEAEPTEVGLVAMDEQDPSLDGEPEPEPEPEAAAEEVLSDSTLSPSAPLSPAPGGLRGRGHLAADSEAEAATASDSSTGPEWCVVKEGRGKREGAPSTPLPPVPAPLVGNCPGGEGGDKAPPGDEDAGELREEAPAEEEEDDIDEDWGEL